MNKPKIIIAIAFILFVGNLYAQSFKFSIEEENNEKQIEYDIEFLKDKDSQLGDIFRFRGNEYKLEIIPKPNQYFRVRRIGKHNAIGFWSETFPIEDFLQKEITEIKKIDPPEISKNDDVFLELEKDGKPLLFLNGKFISIKPNASSSIGIEETKYRLNNGEWKTYNQKSLEFVKDGEYQMDYYSIDLLGNREETKSVIFLVDNIPPKSRIVLPQYVDETNEKVYSSGDAYLKIESEDEVSGIDKTFYRLTCKEGKATEYKLYEKELPLKDIIGYCGSDLEIEYFSIDKVGNKEFNKALVINYEK